MKPLACKHSTVYAMITFVTLCIPKMNGSLPVPNSFMFTVIVIGLYKYDSRRLDEKRFVRAPFMGSTCIKKTYQQVYYKTAGYGMHKVQPTKEGVASSRTTSSSRVGSRGTPNGATMCSMVFPMSSRLNIMLSSLYARPQSENKVGVRPPTRLGVGTPLTLKKLNIKS
ncbi:hypothetical protein HanPI659440_Chr09g0354691 [Helianthus annuus]|nr:hypothetical protein HanPI659440_Chr09g0354691 [Helianthus annuus]